MSRLEEYLNKTKGSIEFVKVESLEQMDRVIENLNQRKINTGHLEKLKSSLPIYVNMKDGGWTDLGDRAADYVSFNEYFK